MAISMVPLDSNKHKTLRVDVDPTYPHIGQQSMIPLLASEFLAASTNFPIVFVKQQETGQFKAVALLGFSSGENLVFNQGKVFTHYVPVNIRRYPFAAGGENITDDNLVLCIDENSELLHESKGVRIFNDDGSLTEATQQMSNLVSDMIAKEQATDKFIKTLVENDLLQATEFTVRLGPEGEHKINGVYKVDEQVLQSLSDDVVLSLYKQHYFPAIYAHLASLSQINRLLQLKANQKAS
ncbi:SapC family protein [Thalassotalea ganghwensis]